VPDQVKLVSFLKQYSFDDLAKALFTLKADATRLKRAEYGIRLVYEEKRIIERLMDAVDRSLQIDILATVCDRILTFFHVKQARRS
jgi:hypothetical protein